MNGWMTYKGSISLRLESGNSLSIDRITPNFGVNVGRTFVWSLGLRSFLVHSASVHCTSKKHSFGVIDVCHLPMGEAREESFAYFTHLNEPRFDIGYVLRPRPSASAHGQKYRSSGSSITRSLARSKWRYGPNISTHTRVKTRPEEWTSREAVGRRRDGGRRTRQTGRCPVRIELISRARACRGSRDS